MPVFVTRAAIFALSTVVGALAVAPAQAQSVVAYVNGEPISSHEVEQRMRINRIARQPASSRSAALKELVDDRVKLAEARRMGYRITDDHMDEQVQRIAKSNNQTLFEFHQNLSKSGIDINAYKQRLKAAYAWDIINEKRMKGTDGTSFETIFKESATPTGRSVDYTLYSVIFVVPRGASPGSRMAEANAARARFNDCSTGLSMLRGMRDVAVKPPVRRSSDGLSPQLNKLLEATPVNRMSQAFPSPQGIEAVAVCEKVARAGRAGAAGSGDDAKRKNADAAKYMQELRSRAVIQYR